MRHIWFMRVLNYILISIEFDYCKPLARQTQSPNTIGVK